MKLLPVLLMICVFASSGLAFAQTEDAAQKQEALQTLKSKLEEEEGKRREMRKRMSGLEREMADTKDGLVGIAGSVRENENKLIRLDERIKALEQERADIAERLKKDHGSIAGLILALERMRRVPSEALIARPGAPLDTARSALLMQSVLPVIHGRADDLNRDLARLKKIAEDLEADKAEAARKSRELEDKHTQMAAMLGKRETLYRQIETDYMDKQAEIKEVSAQARNLEDLIIKLEDSRRRSETREMTRKAVMAAPRSLPRPGQARLPVSGLLRTAFGEKNDIGAISEGVTITSLPGALVVSPMGGEIRFAGTFKNFGNMVIIEHEGGYHSLVAGLARIDTVVGQKVAPGEPVGVLPSGNPENPAEVYYELRLNGRPVNPARKFAELKS